MDLLWLDDGWVQPGCNAQDIDMDGLAAMARRHQPGLIVVDRTIRGQNENYVTPEGLIPPHYLPYPWETCMPLGNSWNYLPNDAFKSTGTLVRNLCTIVARGGNYLIGIGPGPDGEFDPTVYARLKELGAWLKVNGEAIYATRPLPPYEQGDCVFTTRRDGTAYAIILPRDDNGTLPATVAIPAELAASFAEISLLGHGVVPAGVTQGKVTTLTIPAAARANPPCAHAWGLKLAPKAKP